MIILDVDLLFTLIVLQFIIIWHQISPLSSIFNHEVQNLINV